jgi:hypothetical protein
VDATSHEEASATLKLLLAFSFDSDAGRAYLQAMRTFGAAEVDMTLLKTGLLVSLPALQQLTTLTMDF